MTNTTDFSKKRNKKMKLCIDICFIVWYNVINYYYKGDFMKTVVSVIGKDAVGIIAKVSNICSECNANILDITQSVLQDMFVMVMLTEIKELNCTFAEFSDKMKELGKENNLDIRVMHEDIFNSMHRI